MASHSLMRQKSLIKLCTAKINLLPTDFHHCLKFDGCSKGNPGPAGAGAVIYEDGHEAWTKSHYVGEKETNNVAEYNGLIIGLTQSVEFGIRNLIVKGDSQLVIKQMKGEYQVKSPNIIELYQKAKQLESHFDNVMYEHIYREDNSRADELANNALFESFKNA
jgi:ribonuclease HI